MLIICCRKHSKYHRKDFPCSVTKCTKAFSTRKDLTRHERTVHVKLYSGESTEEYSCHHLECRGREPFLRKDHFVRHLGSKKHSRNNDQELEDNENKEVEGSEDNDDDAEEGEDVMEMWDLSDD